MTSYLTDLNCSAVIGTVTIRFSDCRGSQRLFKGRTYLEGIAYACTKASQYFLFHFHYSDIPLRQFMTLYSRAAFLSFVLLHQPLS